MPDSVHTILLLTAVFCVVFALNVAPAFAPPTWTVLSFISVKFDVNFLALALVGAAAATVGRVVLARLSKVILREKLLKPQTRRNIDSIRSRIESRPRLTVGIFLLYAFSPFPSNNLFIAYGMTAMPLRLIAIPFFAGRLISYSFWAFTGAGLGRRIADDSNIPRSLFSIYFLIAQLFTLLLVYVFAKIDWEVLFTERRVKWRTGK